MDAPLPRTEAQMCLLMAGRFDQPQHSKLSLSPRHDAPIRVDVRMFGRSEGRGREESDFGGLRGRPANDRRVSTSRRDGVKERVLTSMG